MENDTRIVKAISYLENAIYQLEIKPLRKRNIKQSKTAIRNAITLMRNTKSDLRIINIEREINLIKDYILKNKEELK